MSAGKKETERLRKVVRADLAALEEKCKAGNATREEYQELNKLRKKMK